MTTIMKMPASYVEVSKDEMEYDGGAWPVVCFIASLACTGASVALYYTQKNGITNFDSQTAQNISNVLFVAGTALGFASGLGAVTQAVAKGAALSTFGGVTAVSGMTVDPVVGAFNTYYLMA